MKKNRLLIIGIVAALLLTGVAFAAWTTNVDVNVNAKSGEMDVALDSKEILYVSDYVEFNKKDIKFSEDKKTATVTIDNMYPGSEVVFLTYIENTGTIPITLDKLTHAAIKVLDKDTNASYGLDNEIFEYFNAEYQVAVADKDEFIMDMLYPVNTEKMAWVEDVYVDNNMMQIEPGEYLILYTRVYLDERAENNTENKLFQFSVTPQFGQANGYEYDKETERPRS